MIKIELSQYELEIIEKIRGRREFDARRRGLVLDIASRASTYACKLYNNDEDDIDIGSYTKLLPRADLTYLEMEYKIISEFLSRAKELAELVI